MRFLFVVAASTIVAACAGVHGSKAGTPTDRRLPPSDVPGAVTPGQAKQQGIKETSKRVARKHAPITLVAADSSRCDVSEEQFQTTHEGDSFVCAWVPAPSKSGI